MCPYSEVIIKHSAKHLLYSSGKLRMNKMLTEFKFLRELFLLKAIYE